MNCIVTAGPTYESLDTVRRLTNFSTGRIGTELANFLTAKGHDVTLLVGEQASYPGKRKAARVETFTNTANLREQLESMASKSVNAVFHASAVSDFTFGKIWRRSPQGELTEIKSGKISTREGTIVAELVPTPKVISSMRDWFPQAKLIGWKYEVEGKRPAVEAAAVKQIRECLTDACVANGPAYGEGFGVVIGNGKCTHLETPKALFETLEAFIRQAGFS